MRVQIIAQDPNFGAVLLALTESVNDCAAIWQSDWSVAKPDGSLLILCYIENPQRVEVAAEFLRCAADARPRPTVIVIGDELDAESKIKLLKLGAIDCLDRPVNLQRLRYLVDSTALRIAALERREAAEEMNGNHASSRKSHMDETVRKLAAVDSSLLLTGETGVGKSFVARQIHDLSRRSRNPFVTINCAAIPETLVESEFFGHKKGSFTGADANKTGKLAHAGKGTVLLDELDALPITTQAKLLHAVEDREFQPVGSHELIRLDARIIAASNQDLEELVATGRFRSDLFFRLDVYQLSIPPLRERTSEIEYFASLFAKEFSQKNDCEIPVFSDRVIEIFVNYSWPGNLRELRNCIEHSAINSQGKTISEQHLPARVVREMEHYADGTNRVATIPMAQSESHLNTAMNAEAGIDWQKTKHEIMKLLRILEANDYNRTRAAKEMGISRTALYKKLHRYHLA